MNTRTYSLMWLVLIFSCDRNKTIDYIVDTNFLPVEMKVTKKISVFANTIELNIPVKWKIITQNDSVLTVDNQELDDVSKYQIFTLTSHQLRPDSRELVDNLRNYMNKIVYNKKCCQILDYGVLNYNKNIGYNLSIDMEQKELLGSNLLATYLMPSIKYERKYYFFLSHTYGKYQTENQKVLYAIFNSISERMDDSYLPEHKENSELESTGKVVKLDSLFSLFADLETGSLIDCNSTQPLDYLKDRNLQVEINNIIVDFTILGTPMYSVLLDNNHYGFIAHIDGEIGPYITLSIYDEYLNLVTNSTLSSCQGDECYYSLSKALYSSKGVFIIDSEDIIDASENDHLILQKTKFRASILKSGKVHRDIISRYSSDYNC